MKIVIAMDSFKGSMSSLEAGEAAAEGMKRVFPEAEMTVLPLADGGEGTAAALVSGMGGEMRFVTVTGPCGRPVRASYGVLRDGRTAVIETAAAAGLTLIPQAERDPMKSTTAGVGELIRDALKNGCRDFIIGLGGSGTNDGGAGMLGALDFRLLDRNGDTIPAGAEGLSYLESIDCAGALPELKECTFRVACDVTNPLCGENGCSAVFSPQKGASPEDAAHMDRLLERFAELSAEKLGKDHSAIPGAGAAGGLGFAFAAFLGGKTESGINIVMKELRFEEYLAGADIFITGEGRLDAQTSMGKGPAGASGAAKKHGCTVIAFAGSVPESGAAPESIDAYFPIVRRPCSAEEAMLPENARQNLSAAAEQTAKLIKRVMSYEL